MKKTVLILSLSGVLLSGCASLSPETDTAMRYTEQGWTYTAVAESDWAAAEQMLLAKLDTNPHDSFARFNLGIVYAQTGRMEDAVQAFNGCMNKAVDKAVRVQMADGAYRDMPDLALLAELMIAEIQGRVTVRDIQDARAEPTQETVALAEIAQISPAEI